MTVPPTPQELKVCIYLPRHCYGDPSTPQKYADIFKSCPCCSSPLVSLLDTFDQETTAAPLLDSDDHVMTGGWYCQQCGVHMQPGDEPGMKGDEGGMRLSKKESSPSTGKQPPNGALSPLRSPGKLIDDEYTLWERQMRNDFQEFLGHIRELFQSKEELLCTHQLDLCQRERDLLTSEDDVRQRLNRVEDVEKDLAGKIHKLSEYKEKMLYQVRREMQKLQKHATDIRETARRKRATKEAATQTDAAVHHQHHQLMLHPPALLTVDRLHDYTPESGYSSSGTLVSPGKTQNGPQDDWARPTVVPPTKPPRTYNVAKIQEPPPPPLPPRIRTPKNGDTKSASKDTTASTDKNGKKVRAYAYAYSTMSLMSTSRSFDDLLDGVKGGSRTPIVSPDDSKDDFWTQRFSMTPSPSNVIETPKLKHRDGNDVDEEWRWNTRSRILRCRSPPDSAKGNIIPPRIDRGPNPHRDVRSITDAKYSADGHLQLSSELLHKDANLARRDQVSNNRSHTESTSRERKDNYLNTNVNSSKERESKPVNMGVTPQIIPDGSRVSRKDRPVRERPNIRTNPTHSRPSTRTLARPEVLPPSATRDPATKSQRTLVERRSHSAGSVKPRQTSSERREREETLSAAKRSASTEILNEPKTPSQHDRHDARLIESERRYREQTGRHRVGRERSDVKAPEQLRDNGLWHWFISRRADTTPLKTSDLARAGDSSRTTKVRPQVDPNLALPGRDRDKLKENVPGKEGYPYQKENRKPHSLNLQLTNNEGKDGLERRLHTQEQKSVPAKPNLKEINMRPPREENKLDNPSVPSRVTKVKPDMTSSPILSKDPLSPTGEKTGATRMHWQRSSFREQHTSKDMNPVRNGGLGQGSTVEERTDRNIWARASLRASPDGKDQGLLLNRRNQPVTKVANMDPPKATQRSDKDLAHERTGTVQSSEKSTYHSSVRGTANLKEDNLTKSTRAQQLQRPHPFCPPGSEQDSVIKTRPHTDMADKSTKPNELITSPAQHTASLTQRYEPQFPKGKQEVLLLAQQKGFVSSRSTKPQSTQQLELQDPSKWALKQRREETKRHAHSPGETSEEASSATDTWNSNSSGSESNHPSGKYRAKRVQVVAR